MTPTKVEAQMRSLHTFLRALAVAMIAFPAWAAELGPAAEAKAKLPAPETCGKPPSEPGNWKCVARKVTSITQTNPTTRVKEAFNRITVTWTNGGKTMQDSWDAK
jgi:hypothetical protein